jgi:hypothetical protein
MLSLQMIHSSDVSYQEKTMATIEERLQALEREHERLQALEQEHQVLEREHAQLKKTIEMQAIAIGALVNKATLEKLNEKYDKIFDALIAHDRLTNERLGDIQNQLIETDGKVAGLQTEMRQRLNEQDGKIVGLQTEMRQRFNEQDSKIAEHTTLLQQHPILLQEILKRLPEK